MKKTITFALFATMLCAGSGAEAAIPMDTARVIDIEDVVVVASPKMNGKLRQQPLSVSLFSQDDMEAAHITSVKGLTALTPNMFMPDYGSHLSSAIYIRGIGSRINTPAVGLYVDNMPYLDKTAFDFNFYDIERINVLRGPQGTLFGRNTMGGLIQVYTKNPFHYQGTDVRLTGSTQGGHYGASLTHYHRVSDQFAFSAGGFYEAARGFFKNRTLDKWADPLQSGGGRMRAIYNPQHNLKFDLSLSYEYSDEGAFPYGKVNAQTGRTAKDSINSNLRGKYRRGMFNGGLNIEYQASKFIFNSVSSYQHFNDRMFMDQDFTAADLYTLEQKQRADVMSQDFVFKSRPDVNWQWTTGANVYYERLRTLSDVGFGTGFIGMLQGTMDAAMTHSPVKVALADKDMHSPGYFWTPSFGTAVYHQSTYENLFGLKGLSATAGLRLDYEKEQIDYDTKAALNYNVTMRGYTIGKGSYAAQYMGMKTTDYLELLPKFALAYKFDAQNNVFAQVSRGMRSGGFNIQMVSEYLESGMMKNKGLANNDADVNQALKYKPEFSWNYEAGTHLTLLQKKLWADLTAFYIATRDQQVSRFVESGLGRYTANAGKSHSYGAEATLLAQITEALSAHAAYGYTRSTFTDYEAAGTTSTSESTDYTGRYVPFVPRNTVAVGAAYTFRFNSEALQSITLNADYRGVGKTYWTESNSVAQPYYGVYNGRISLKNSVAQLDLWAENIFNKTYNAFCFETMHSAFAQMGRPRYFGFDVRMHF
jgi:outer membrane receptor protein involved in Fe transport